MSHVISSSAIANILNAKKNVKGASFTVKSLDSGKDYTYKISRSEFRGTWYTHVKVETQYLEFKRLGSFFNGKIFNKKQVVESPSAKAIAFVLEKVSQGKTDWLDTKMETMHLGQCIRCGKTLTDATSIAHGLGAVCRGQQ